MYDDEVAKVALVCDAILWYERFPECSVQLRGVDS